MSSRTLVLLVSATLAMVAAMPVAAAAPEAPSCDPQGPLVDRAACLVFNPCLIGGSCDLLGPVLREVCDLACPA